MRNDRVRARSETIHSRHLVPTPSARLAVDLCFPCAPPELLVRHAHQVPRVDLHPQGRHTLLFTAWIGHTANREKKKCR